MKALAIIPARGGSKRIPRKNIKDFNGKPMIAWAIQTAIESGLFDEIMVSTEDAEIAEIALKHKAKIPFLRSPQNASDMAGTEEVILEVLKQYELLNVKFELVCCIYPTTPLMSAKRLLEAKNKLIEGNYDTIFPALRYGHPVQRAFKDSQNKMELVWPEFVNYRTQDLETYYHDAGQYYWIRTDQFLAKKEIFTTNTGCIELNELEAQDIDNLSDWDMAVLKHRYLNKI